MPTPSDLTAARRADDRLCIQLTIGQVWSALVAYRYTPSLALIMLLRLLVPGGNPEVSKLLSTTMAWYADDIPLTEAELFQLTQIEAIDQRHSEIAPNSPEPDSGHHKAAQAQDRALHTLLTDDPDVFLRRAKTLSAASESLLDVARTMLEGGGIVEVGGGNTLEVPRLEISGSLRALKSLVETSNGLFKQVQGELDLFSERQLVKDRQDKKELGDLDPVLLIAALGRRELGWTAHDVAEKLGVMIVDCDDGYELRRIDVDKAASVA